MLREAYRFRHAYANIPSTGASHATMLTSLYACNHGKTDNSWVLSSHIRSVAQVLHDVGVETASVVAGWDLWGEKSGFDRGFSTYVQDKRRNNPLQYFWVRLSARALRRGLPDTLFTKPYLTMMEILDHAERIIHRALRSRQRFFVFLHFKDVHEPYSILEAQDYFEVPSFQALRVMRSIYGGDPVTEDMAKVFRAIYDANAKMLDQRLGSFLRNMLLTDDIAVILTSDHGENAFGKKRRDTGAPYAGKNQTLYETEVHVPLVLLHRSLQGPILVRNVVSSVDLAPTILELLDVEGIEEFQGQPLWERGIHSPVFMERLDWFSRKEAAWLRWPWKLIVVPGPENDGMLPSDHVLELYNLEDDCQEISNVYEEEREIGGRLLEELLQFIVQQTDFYRECHREKPTVDEDKVVRERLRMLGYIE
jgi:arylsulfatase A-like enzyme